MRWETIGNVGEKEVSEGNHGENGGTKRTALAVVGRTEICGWGVTVTDGR